MKTFNRQQWMFLFIVTMPVRINHQAYVDRVFYNRITGASKVENYRETLSTIYRDKDFPLFMRMALQHGLTMMFVGETGSGKTTYLKSLTEFIPRDLRIITIEDNPEVLLPEQRMQQSSLLRIAEQGT